MELDLRDYLKIIRKRIWLLISLVVVMAMGTAVFSYYFLNPVYQASTKLIVNKKADIADQLDINSVNLNIRLIDTYKEVIKTTAIMDKVASQYPQLGLTPEELIGKVQVSAVNNTQVMTLSVKDESHEQAVQIVNAIANVFVQEIPKLITVDNVSILNEAKQSNSPVPVEPNPKLNIAISIVIALMLGVGIAFLLEYLDDTVKTDQDVQELLGLPTVAMIPRMKRSDVDKAIALNKEMAGGSGHVKASQ